MAHNHIEFPTSKCILVLFSHLEQQSQNLAFSLRKKNATNFLKCLKLYPKILCLKFLNLNEFGLFSCRKICTLYTANQKQKSCVGVSKHGNNSSLTKYDCPTKAVETSKTTKTLSTSPQAPRTVTARLKTSGAVQATTKLVTIPKIAMTSQVTKNTAIQVTKTLITTLKAVERTQIPEEVICTPDPVRATHDTEKLATTPEAGLVIQVSKNVTTKHTTVEATRSMNNVSSTPKKVAATHASNKVTTTTKAAVNTNTLKKSVTSYKAVMGTQATRVVTSTPMVATPNTVVNTKALKVTTASNVVVAAQILTKVTKAVTKSQLSKRITTTHKVTPSLKKVATTVKPVATKQASDTGERNCSSLGLIFCYSMINCSEGFRTETPVIRNWSCSKNYPTPGPDAIFFIWYHPSEMTLLFSHHQTDQNFKTINLPLEQFFSGTDAKSTLTSEKL